MRSTGPRHRRRCLTNYKYSTGRSKPNGPYSASGFTDARWRTDGQGMAAAGWREDTVHRTRLALYHQTTQFAGLSATSTRCDLAANGQIALL